mmetsp:Transcript_8297/g.20268  ORF Transcript_8297/g.20268 Transcript_8297/m.20268 type:complete len:121 (+) Transcript_8297:2252-2614(+)
MGGGRLRLMLRRVSLLYHFSRFTGVIQRLCCLSLVKRDGMRNVLVALVLIDFCWASVLVSPGRRHRAILEAGDSGTNVKGPDGTDQKADGSFRYHTIGSEKTGGEPMMQLKWDESMEWRG